MTRTTARDRRPPREPVSCEIEALPGLESTAQAELKERFGRRVELLAVPREGIVPVRFDGRPGDLLGLRSALAVYGRRWFEFRNPGSLVHGAERNVLRSLIDEVRALHPRDSFRTLRIAAAGSDSPLLRQLAADLGRQTRLEPVATEGDLVIRLRRPLDRPEGWDVLIRLSPRPLSARAWRVCNLRGALNATIAYAMVRYTRPSPDDRVLNIACGSGTLLVERLLVGPARQAIGCDPSEDAIECATRNLEAAGVAARLEPWDAGEVPLPDGSMTVLLADLPFGQTVGSHAENRVLYPRLLEEAARIAAPGARFAAITQDLRLCERAVQGEPAWSIERVVPLQVPFARGYLHPRIYLLARKA